LIATPSTNPDELIAARPDFCSYPIVQVNMTRQASRAPRLSGGEFHRNHILEYLDILSASLEENTFVASL
jgi:hypothetical protein